MISLIIGGNVGIIVFQLLLSLSILVILHEFGHYITARWFGCRVEKFYLFFDPWFSLFKKKVGDTEYGVGWLPLGGYVKISGMIDESMDKDALKLPPQPYEFRSKPAWQRLIIMLGGVIMNVIAAVVIYMFIGMIWGEKKVPANSLKYGLSIQDSLMTELGFKNGDNIVSVNDKRVDDFLELPLQLVLGDNVQVIRDGKPQTIVLPTNLLGKLVEKKRAKTPLFTIRSEAIVFDYIDSMGAAKAGIEVGDRITSIDSVPVQFGDEVRGLITPHKNSTVLVGVNRGGVDTSFTVNVNAEGQVGVFTIPTIMQADSLGLCKLEITKYGFFQSIPAAFRMAKQKLSDQVDQLQKIFSPKTEGYKAVGGFKAIGGLFTPEWNWENFWEMTALLSIVLAVMNLLPIPALDGGHVLFTLIEMISGKKPNQKFLEYAQVVGMVLLLALMLYANLNHWFGYGKDK
jgi:regulator of sigma E protease